MKIITTLVIILSFFYSFNINAQSNVTNHLFIVKNNGDTLVTSKILDEETNEDQVVFVLEGRDVKLKASEVISYFNQGLKIRINISPESQSKLASIIIKGDILLARSTSSKAGEIFYISYNDKWIRLDPSTVNLKEKLSQVISDFDKTILDEKIYYDLVSLGDVIARYNEYKYPNFKKVGKFQFSDKVKIGVYGSAGISFANIGESNTYLGVALSGSIGIGTHIRYSRMFSGSVKLGYSRNKWVYENIEINLKSLDFSPVFLAQFYNRSNSIKVSGGVGLKMMLYIDSEIISPLTGFSGPKILALGYVFQLNCSFDDAFDFFTSYQYMPNQNSTHNGIFNSVDQLKFETTTIQVGGLFYFMRM